MCAFVWGCISMSLEDGRRMSVREGDSVCVTVWVLELVRK